MITEERLSTIEKCLRKVRPTNSSRTRHYLPDFSSTAQPRAVLSTRFSHHPAPLLLQRFTSPNATNRSLEGTTRSLTRMVKRPFLQSFSTTPRKSSRIDGEKVSKLNEFIEICSKPICGSEQRLRKNSPKLSVSFQELKDCLGPTWAESRGTGAVNTVIKQMRRQKREEGRNITDKASVQMLVNQRREVSNYIITNFRRQPVWKHVGVIVPRKLEESIHQYQSGLKF